MEALENPVFIKDGSNNENEIYVKHEILETHVTIPTEGVSQRNKLRDF